jgi:hypothetical protein
MGVLAALLAGLARPLRIVGKVTGAPLLASARLLFVRHENAPNELKPVDYWRVDPLTPSFLRVPETVNACRRMRLSDPRVLRRWRSGWPTILLGFS